MSIQEPGRCARPTAHLSKPDADEATYWLREMTTNTRLDARLRPVLERIVGTGQLTVEDMTDDDPDNH